MTDTRTVDGVELPTAGTFALDPSHSAVTFSTRHLMVSKVRGRFGSFEGSIIVGDDPLASSVEVTIAADSIDTGDATRDEHLRSADFLDVASHPTLTFGASDVASHQGDRFKLEGQLTVLGTSRPVALDAEFGGVVEDPWGNERMGFSATAEIDREDWGLTWNQTLETGGVLVGKKVRIDIEAEAVRQR